MTNLDATIAALTAHVHALLDAEIGVSVSAAKGELRNAYESIEGAPSIFRTSIDRTAAAQRALITIAGYGRLDLLSDAERAEMEAALREHVPADRGSTRDGSELGWAA
jgi:hypothetical protein